MDKDDKSINYQQKLIDKLVAENKKLSEENAELRLKIEVDNNNFEENSVKIKQMMQEVSKLKIQYEEGLKEIDKAKEEYKKALDNVYLLKKKYKEGFKKIANNI